MNDPHIENGRSDSENPGYLLLFRGRDWDEQLAPENMLEVMNRFQSWSDNLAKAGKVKGGQALSRTGAVISGRHGHVVVDGPFAESKEAIGGYLFLQVDTLEEAMAIAKTSPGLDFGGSIEVRPALAECPCFKRIKQRLGLVEA
ncbi:MAG: YciI family protein [Verrucomicrobiota bacterium]